MSDHGHQEETEARTSVNTDYEEAFGTALALLEECAYEIGEGAYAARRIAQKALEAWGQEQDENLSEKAQRYPEYQRHSAKGRAYEAYSEACHFEAFAHDLLARWFQEKARRGQNPKAEIEAIFWKAQADIARKKAYHYPTQKDAVQAYEKAVAEARTEASEASRQEAEAEAVQKALAQSSETLLAGSEETDDDPGKYPEG